MTFCISFRARDEPYCKVLITPLKNFSVGGTGVEPVTSCMSSKRSNQTELTARYFFLTTLTLVCHPEHGTNWTELIARC